MARGWESKSVEQQMASALEVAAPRSAPPARKSGAARPSPTEAPSSDETRRQAEQERATRERQLQSLHLQRESILSQKTSNPGRRAALEAALAQIESQIHAIE